MSRSTIDAVISRLDELRQAQGHDFAVVLHGGEPLLLGEALLTPLLTGLRAHLADGMHLVGADERDASHRSVARSVLRRRGHGLGKSRRTAENQRRSACAIRPGRDLRGCARRHLSPATPPRRRATVFRDAERGRTVHGPRRNLLVPARARRTWDELSSARRQPHTAALRQDQLRFSRRGGMVGRPLRCLHE